MAFLSPLRYPGSKRRFVPYIERALALNKLQPELFVEPFAGGASVSLGLLQRKVVKRVILADIDPWIASFWKAVFWDTEWLIEQIQKTSITLDEWEKIKRSQPENIRQQAWACLFLNRTSFSGILRPEVGPLGGKAQDSPYKINCRFPKKTLVRRIQRISTFRDKIYAVWNLSWEDTLTRVFEIQQDGKLPVENVFYYFDPPFFKKGNLLYRYYFNANDHKRLRDVLLNLKQKWLLSYDSAEDVEVLYSQAITSRTNGTKRLLINLPYSLSRWKKRKRGEEIVLSNLEILPEFDG